MSVFCPACGAENEAGSRFCFSCGYSIESSPSFSGSEGPGKMCPECGEKNAPDDLFCGNCGHRFSPVDIGKEKPSNRRFPIETGEEPVSGCRCPHCGTFIPDGAKECPNCKYPLVMVDPAPNTDADDGSNTKKKERNDSGSKKTIIIAIAAVLIVLIIAAAVVIAIGMSKKNNTPEASDTATEETVDEVESEKETETQPATTEQPTTNASLIPVLTNGSVITFGQYPQTEVTDGVLIDRLNELSWNKDWLSFGYSYGSGNVGSAYASDIMRYVDVTMDGQEYRGVYISEYRPYWAFLPPDAEHSQQDDNGYYAGETYWFVFEPIKWKVLDAASGLLVSQLVLDSQPRTQTQFVSVSSKENYLNGACTVYASNFEQSYLCSWLNHNFYNIAFSPAEEKYIKAVSRSNIAADELFSKYNGSPSTDKVSLLSFTEMQNSAYGYEYGIAESTTRKAYCTDYARCQGVYANNSVCLYYHVRNPGSGSAFSAGVRGNNGEMYYDNRVESTRTGVLPSIYVTTD